MKRGIKDDLNRLLQGNVLAKRRDTGEVKLLCALKLDGQEGISRSENHVPRKVWMTMAKDAQDALRQGDSVNIGIVKEDTTRPGKWEEG